MEEKIYLPKHSDEVEQALLWSVLINWDSLVTINELQDYMFYDNINKLLYRELVNMFKEKVAIDIVTFKDRLEKKSIKINDEYVNLLEHIGWVSYLTELTEMWSSFAIEDYSKIIIEKYKLRELNKILDKWRFNIWRYLDFSNCLSSLTEDIKKLEISSNKNDFISLKDIFKDRFSNLINSLNWQENEGCYTWFKSLDNKLWPLLGWQLIVVWWRPWQGKTSFALNIINNNVLLWKKVLLFSMEMNGSQLADRFISINTWYNSFQLNKFSFSLRNKDKEFLAQKKDEIMSLANQTKEYVNNNLLIDCSTKLTVSDIRRKVMLESMNGKIDMIVIDYLWLLTPEKSYTNKANEIADITRELKNLSWEFDCPVILLSQLSRQVESRWDKRPIMSDLRDSGSIEQDANKIIMLYRDRYYNESSEDWTLECLIKKNREWINWTVNLFYDLQSQKIEDLRMKK